MEHAIVDHFGDQYGPLDGLAAAVCLVTRPQLGGTCLYAYCPRVLYPLSHTAWCRGQEGGMGVLKRSGVAPQRCSSRACLHTAFIAFSVYCVFD